LWKKESTPTGERISKWGVQHREQGTPLPTWRLPAPPEIRKGRRPCERREKGDIIEERTSATPRGFRSEKGARKNGWGISKDMCSTRIWKEARLEKLERETKIRESQRIPESAIEKW